MLRQTVPFNGADSNNFGGLWVTNGTAAGTSELTGISGTDTNSMDFGLDPLGFAVVSPRRTRRYSARCSFQGCEPGGQTAPGDDVHREVATIARAYQSRGHSAARGCHRHSDGGAPVRLAKFNHQDGPDAAPLLGAISRVSALQTQRVSPAANLCPRLQAGFEMPLTTVRSYASARPTFCKLVAAPATRWRFAPPVCYVPNEGTHRSIPTRRT